ncbi:Zinc finger Y-chromosomal protein 1 [Armadillidium vulgare]|nr:Zinc finger Y-chromosomal protein 1 [Armadillidium vulgare]
MITSQERQRLDGLLKELLPSSPFSSSRTAGGGGGAGEFGGSGGGGAGVYGGLLASISTSSSPSPSSSAAAATQFWLQASNQATLAASAKAIRKDMWTCNFCNKIFASRYYYERHMKCHLNQKEECPFCSFRSTYKWNLKSHIQKKHINHQLPDPHLTTSLLGKRVLTCHVCGRTFDDLSRLRLHIKYHERYHRSSNICPICGRKSQSPSHLLVHIRTHTGERPHACTQCSYRASDPSNLTKHIRKKHPYFSPS